VVPRSVRQTRSRLPDDKHIIDVKAPCSRTDSVSVSFATLNNYFFFAFTHSKGIGSAFTAMAAAFDDTSIDWCKVPVQAPPSGQTANFTNPPSRAYQIYAAAAVCLPLILIFGGLRLYSKVGMGRLRSWDDLSFTFAMICAIFYITSTVAVIADKPYGLHEWDVVVCQFTKTEAILTLILNSLYGVCIWLVKSSVLILYFVLFGLLRWMRISVYLGIIISGIVYIGYMIAFLATCSPTPGKTTQMDYLLGFTSPSCLKMDQASNLLGAWNVATDLYLLVLPIYPIWQLRMPRARKLGVSAVFLTGIIALIASTVGLVFRVQEGGQPDRTWVVISAWLTGFVEMTAGTMVCCMPALTVVFAAWTKPVVKYLSKSRYGRGILTTTGIGQQEMGRLENKDDSYPLGRKPSGDSYPMRNNPKEVFLNSETRAGTGRSGESLPI
jgi:hypothetical protein